MPKRQNRVRKPLQFDKHASIKGGLFLLVLLVVTGIGLFLNRHWTGAMHNMEEFVAKAVGAKVEHVMVEGLVNTDPVELKEAIQLGRGDSLVGFNSSETRARIEKVTWVKLASVERKLPDTIRVHVYEHMPLARLQDSEGMWVIDKHGRMIDESDERFEYLPLISGEGAAAKASELFVLLSETPKISEKVVQATYIGERRWNLGFESGVTVQLPEENPSMALSVLTRLDEKRHVLSMQGGVIDLRLEDRIVIRLKEGQTLDEKLL